MSSQVKDRIAGPHSITSEAELDSTSVSAEEVEYSLEDALNSVEHGLFQWLLLLALGLACASFSANVVLMSFLEPNVIYGWFELLAPPWFQVGCQWGLNKTEEAFLSVVVFVGMMIGSTLWGSVSDSHGRKLSVALSLLVEGVFGFFAAVSTEYWELLASRAAVGVGVGGLATSFSTYSEFLPTSVRGYNLCWYQLFWAMGGIAETALAWVLVPTSGWRMLAFSTAIPPVILLPLMVAFMPESPRYMSVVGNTEHAQNILLQMARLNGTALPSGYLKPPPAESPRDISPAAQLRSLFVPPLSIVTSLLWFLAFTLGVGYYGSVILAAEVRSNQKDVTCQGDSAQMNDGDYASILIDACAELPGVLLALFTIERLGRVRSLFGSWIACLISMALLASIPSQKTAFLFVARFFTVYADVFIFIITAEAYPTAIRGVGCGAMSSVSQMGGLVSPFMARSLLDARGLRAVSCFCGGFFLVASVSTCFLTPYETTGHSLRENVSEMRRSESRLLPV